MTSTKPYAWKSVLIGKRYPFWPRVHRHGSRGCWVWTGTRSSCGYGRIISKGKRIKVHRMMYEAFVGSIPLEMFVCHSCDNRACCNPKHLFLGTQLDNMRDCVKKDRHNRGSRNCNAKLNEESIKHIRELASTGMTGKQIAEIFGVSNARIYEILNDHAWRHV